MRSLVDQLSQYAAYHQDGRNVATHFVGIPMIVVAVTMLLSRPAAPELLPGGIALSALLALSLWAGQWAAAQTT